VPCVPSYVGGIPDMMIGCEQNLYRFEEVEMLAYKVCKVFEREEKQINMCSAAIKRHDQKANSEQLLTIYNEIKG